MLTKAQFIKLLHKQGIVVAYTTQEGGVWKKCHVEPNLAWIKGMSFLQCAHSMRFKSGKEWDEINGMRS